MRKLPRMFITTAVFSALFALPSPVIASENIRVAIAYSRKTVSITSTSGLVQDGDQSNPGEKMIIFTAEQVGGRPVRVRSRNEFTAVNGRSYRGWIELRKDRNGAILVINDLGIEDYLMGVIAEEMPHDWEPEAQKAQAVASRTFAVYQKRNAGKRPYHIRSDENGQIYTGKRGERENSIRAVRETAGLVLMYKGGAIPAFYHSSCGGHTENAAELWDVDEPYLKGVDCDCQEISKYGAWEKRVTLARLRTALGKRGYRIGNIESVGIGSITPAGRVKNVIVRHEGKTASVPAETLRSAIGTSHVLSVFFELETKGGVLVISGRGRGHGVGLCQWGAREMAQKGQDFKAILLRYYPGTELASMNE